MPLTLVLGGQKSGKSSRAAHLAASTGSPVVVIAPAQARGDADFARRIARHRADRPEGWRTAETFDVACAIRDAAAGTAVIVDALDTWLLHLCDRAEVWTPSPDDDVSTAHEAVVLDAVDDLAGCAAAHPGEVIVIAGQPGNGVVALGAGTRRYVDLHGLACQRLANAAQRVELVVAGRVVTLAPGGDVAPRHTSPAVEQPSRRSARAAAGDVPTLLAAAVTPHDDDVVGAARRGVDALAKPPGSLGRLEDLAVQLAGIAGQSTPPVPRRPVLLVAAGDHGVHTRGVSAWPQPLTASIADVVADGRSAAAVMAAELGVEVVVVDVGLAHALRPGTAVVGRRVKAGTADITQAAAMSTAEAERALAAGAEVSNDLVAGGADVLVLGEVGIANTTASAALVAACTGAPPGTVTGRGAGADDATLARKVAAVEVALRRHALSVTDDEPIAVLASLGGLEHAALAGVMLAAAAARIPVILDGVTTLAAALVATHLAPTALGYLIAGHRSSEPGATVALDHLGLAPLLDLDMRLGEGAGGIAALPLVRAAAAMTRAATLADLA